MQSGRPLEIMSSLIVRLLRAEVSCQRWSRLWCVSRVDARAMGRTDVPGWTLLSRSYHRVGRWMSGMASTRRYGLVELESGRLREARYGPGGRVSLWDQQLTPAGESVFLGEASRHGSCRWGVSMAPAGLRARKLFCHWGATLHKYMGRITERCRSWPGRCWEEGIRLCRTPDWDGWGLTIGGPPVSGARQSGRGMWPAGGNGIVSLHGY